MKRLSAQISAFLALIFLLVTALVMVTLESARAAALDHLAGMAARSGIESVFAAFHTDLLQDFGLLAARGRTEERTCWPAEAERYARTYLQPAGGLVRQGDRILLSSLYVKAVDTVYLTEDNGKVFTDAVMNYMTSAGISVLLKETLERLGLFDEDGAASFNGTLQSFLGSDSYSLEDILGGYGDLKKKAEELIAAAGRTAEDETPPGEEGPPQEEKTDLSGVSFSELLDQLKEIKDGGILGLITGNMQLSSLSWNLPDRPSLLPEEEKQLHSGIARADYSFDEILLLGEYLMNQMDCYTSAENGERYEAEYVISGKNSDREALASVAGDLMLIRTGLNFAYLCTDGEKMAAAQTAALAVMSALALPELTSVLKWILIAAWAAAESLVDLRALFQGKRVVLWKSRTSWKLSALSLNSVQEEGGFSLGLSYSDYLRLLFYLKAGPKTAYRMMDVIQARLRKLQADFYIRDYMVQASLSMTAVAATMYLQYPAYRRLSGAGFGRKYTKTAAFSY